MFLSSFSHLFFKTHDHTTSVHEIQHIFKYLRFDKGSPLKWYWYSCKVCCVLNYWILLSSSHWFDLGSISSIFKLSISIVFKSSLLIGWRVFQLMGGFKLQCCCWVSDGLTSLEIKPVLLACLKYQFISGFQLKL